jgi:hypothetical protein
MLGSSWEAAQLAVSQEGPSTMKLGPFAVNSYTMCQTFMLIKVTASHFLLGTTNTKICGKWQIIITKVFQRSFQLFQLFDLRQNWIKMDYYKIIHDSCVLFSFHGNHL